MLVKSLVKQLDCAQGIRGRRNGAVIFRSVKNFPAIIFYDFIDLLGKIKKDVEVWRYDNQTYVG